MAGQLGLSDDEAYYRLWALAPALSYLDHPPMVGWMIAGSRWLIGDTALGVRAGAILTFLIGTAAFWRTASLLFGRHIAETATWIMLAMPLLAVGGIIVTPDMPSVLFAGLTLWALAELHRSGNANWWLVVGVFAGLGLLSKYTNLFLGAGIVAWILAVPSQRHWLASWQLWLGGAIAALLTTPVLYWNAQHGWASFGKQFGRVVRGDDLSPRYILEMAGGFLGLASPLIAVLAVVGLLQLAGNALRYRDAPRTLIAAVVALPLAYFAAHALHARVQANWLAPLYPPLAICAALAICKIPSARWRMPLAIASTALGFLMTAAIYAHAIHPIAGDLLRKDPLDQFRGWAELAAEADRIRLEQGAQWIATSSYATTGQLAFALRGRTEVIQLNERMRYVHLPSPAPVLLQAPAVYVELDRRQSPQLLAQRFRDVKKLGELQRRYMGKVLASYAVYAVAQPFAAGPLLQ